MREKQGGGVDRLTVSKVLNHTIRAATDVYDLYSMGDEKKEATLKWERELKRILGEEQKVVVDFPDGAS